MPLTNTTRSVSAIKQWKRSTQGRTARARNRLVLRHNNGQLTPRKMRGFAHSLGKLEVNNAIA